MADQSVLLSSYLLKLSKIRQGNTRYGKAPHKPILLLSILDLVDQGLILDNRIYITPELISSFRNNWNLLVQTPNRPTFHLPFFHLQRDGFWKIVDYFNKEITEYIHGFSAFCQVVSHGKFDSEFFQLIISLKERAIITKHLLDSYFPDKLKEYSSGKGKYDFLQEVEASILGEKELHYLPKEQDEVAFVRGPQFKKIVPRIYDYTCAMTGMRVDSMASDSLVDACHIVPFSQSGNDSIKNGIALCPNLHRAFDRGLISVDGDYRMIVSSRFVEDESHPYSLRALSGQRIRLPFGDTYQPNKENFLWHRKHRFRG